MADASGSLAAGDPYFLGVTAAVTVGYQMLFFLVTAACKFDTVTDLAGGTNFVILALLTLFLPPRTLFTRQWVLSALVVAWGLRLSGFLFFRILRWGEDRRFDAHRKSFARLAVFWTLQAMWVWVVSLPVTFANSPSASDAPLGALDYVGWVFWVVGGLVEAMGDQQKFNFKQEAANRGRWCDAGVWKWTRHPNYFGEILLWWGIYLSALPSLTGAMHCAAIGPIFTTTLLLFLSGIPLLEKSADERYGSVPGYADYKATTSPLLPIPNALWSPLPGWLKAILFEYPMYNHLSNNGSGNFSLDSADSSSAAVPAP